MNLAIILTAVSPDLAEAWERFCGEFEMVTVYQGSIFDVECDAMVSPANSFGFMDGGIDQLYTDHFGPQLERDVKQMILERHGGELIVGQADLVSTGNAAVPHMVIAPTMRIPTILRHSVNPYLAARAALRLLLSRKDDIGGSGDNAAPFRVAFPGLGTGVGQVSAAVCAHQMAQAIREVVLGEFTPPRTWAEASERHQLLYGDAVRRLQHEPPR